MEFLESKDFVRSFNQGYLKSIKVLKDELFDGWNIWGCDSKGDLLVKLVSQRDNQTRTFKTLDACKDWIEDIGAKVFLVSF